MKHLLLTAVLALSSTQMAFAAGDAAKGESDFKKCKSCHSIINGDDAIVKGGKTGPNLFGVVGRALGSTDFSYSDSMVAAGAAGKVWDEASLIAFIADPKGYLVEATGDAAAKTKMTFKLKTPEDIVAYLASLN